MVSSCATLSPRKQLRNAQETFHRTERILYILKEADKFNDEEVNNIHIALSSGFAILEKWRLAILNDEPTLRFIDLIETITDRLIYYQILGEQR
jgi:hypothetical protein